MVVWWSLIGKELDEIVAIGRNAMMTSTLQRALSSVVDQSMRFFQLVGKTFRHTKLISHFNESYMHLRKWMESRASDGVPLDDVIHKYEDLQSVYDDVSFYQPVTDEELRVIFASPHRDWGSTLGSFGGRFRECPNGHPYVIGECGGAMETSVCNECHAIIGGSDHHHIADTRPSQRIVSLLNLE
jgi:hypothetical protein